MNIGCHVSIAGGVFNAPERANHLGCEIMQIFSRSPQGGKAPLIDALVAEKFKKNCLEFSIKNTYIHTPYYVNFASANNRIRFGSASVVREELERGSLLRAKYVMTHLGTAKDLGKEESLKKTCEMLSRSLDGYEGSCKLLIENSAGAGEIIGNSFEEISYILNNTNNPNIEGICIDTQHSFASGYNWHEFDNVIEKIDKEIGIDKLKLIHANDSQTTCGSRKDRHEHIGKGLIGADSFEKIVEFAQKNNIDMILETEHSNVKEDIELLKRMRDQV